MSESLPGLSLSYILFLAVLLLVLFRSDLQLRVKFFLLAISIGFFWVHYDALKSAQGWPARELLPDSFELIEGVVVEPNPAAGEGGYLYLWIRDLTTDNPVPRSYRLPYGDRLHQRIDEVIKAQRGGRRFVGKPGTGSDGKLAGTIEFEAIERSRPQKNR